MSSVVNVSKSELKKPTDKNLAKFCAAVRDKKDWQTKVLDEKIVLKWVIEAELAAPDSQVLEGDALEAVSELRRSVRAIRDSDWKILLNVRAGSPLQHFDETGLETDLKKTLKYARGSKYGLREPELKENRLGVFVSDDLVPRALHQELIRQLDALAAKEPRDFHPGSFGKVQDLIHPSLYPYIAGITCTSSSDIKLPPVGTDGKFHTKISNLHTQEMTSLFAWIPSVFKLSPDGTDVHIDSYINGLGMRKEYPGLFRVIEKMFLLVLPHFEKTMKASANYTPRHSPSVRRWMERHDFASGGNEEVLTREMWAQFIDENSSTWDAEKLKEKKKKEKLQRNIQQEDSIKESFYKLGDEFVASEIYKGQELKVIVKAANYILTPGREYEGSWHMEGMPHERIVASVIYYYDTDVSIEDQGLSFRKFRDSEADFPGIDNPEFGHEDFQLSFTKNDEDDEDEVVFGEDEDEDCEDNYPSDWETEDYKGEVRFVPTTSIPFFIELGTVPTTHIHTSANGTGRILSFPNWLQHKVGRVRNSSTSDNRVVNRKILCFFLVDDTIQDQPYIESHGFSIEGLEDMNVLTTSEVPMQMCKCNEPTMRALISVISVSLTGVALHRELIDIIWQYVSEGTLSREDAEMYRLSLMRDRKVSTFNRQDDYSLCEH
ncbi:hypothetical protein BDP27DRAFT_1333470 [Rhodocollybia butyracea]|uniref:DUF4246 domain-containing protein n=1 Tax=Rhodocollybia butyracea TaxID=206335 RepID=A0A9P5U2B5_9AGAR|nr:hypothetical protein BDP27DRAFT_1333470 [Rhodocollybia butyracea]